MKDGSWANILLIYVPALIFSPIIGAVWSDCYLKKLERHTKKSGNVLNWQKALSTVDLLSYCLTSIPTIIALSIAVNYLPEHHIFDVNSYFSRFIIASCFVLALVGIGAGIYRRVFSLSIATTPR